MSNVIDFIKAWICQFFRDAVAFVFIGIFLTYQGLLLYFV